MKKYVTLAVAVATLLATAGAAGISHAASGPISGTGWNQDLVVENTTLFDWGAVAGATTADVVGWVFYESGWGSSIQGLNNTGAYVGPSGTSYQMQSYAGNNAILDAGTLTLDTPGQFSELAFLATTQAGGGSIFWNATVNFSDASSTVLNGDGLDWINTSSSGVVVQNHGLGNPGAAQFYNSDLYMVERTFALSPADQLKTVTSIDLAGITPGTHSVFHAISGDAIAAIPEPSSLVLGLIGLVACCRRRRS